VSRNSKAAATPIFGAKARVENRLTKDGHQNGYQRVFRGSNQAVTEFA
jgi:hypothetical protein